MKLVFDIETNGLLNELNKIHCLVMPAELHDMELEAVEKLILPA